jgi:5-(carboxyamino)imidazole ribonucleotide mutase
MSKPMVGVVMGSDSDWRIMKFAAEQLDAFGIPHERKVVSAHRTPDYLYAYAETATDRGLVCVPIPSRHLGGLDSLLSIAQMPAGIPVATFAVGKAGARNAAIFAAEILARTDQRVAARLAKFRRNQRVHVRSLKLPSSKL